MEIQQITQDDDQNNMEKESNIDNIDGTDNLENSVLRSSDESPVVTINSETVEQVCFSTPMIPTVPIQTKTPLEMLNYTPGGSEEWINMIEEKYTPKVGMVFPGLKEGITFYMVYATACGFVPRLSSAKTFRDGVIRTKAVVCNREGKPRDRRKNTDNKPKQDPQRLIKVKRFECKARIVFRYKLGTYVVDGFYAAHNHKLTMVKNREFHKLARNISLYHKKNIVNNLKMNVGATKTYRLCKEQCEGYENVGADLVDFKNFSRDIKCFIGDNDAQMFIDNFKKLTETRPGFFFAYELDKENNIIRVFWADPEARRYYAVFGDGVSYDPTYRTNKYCMVFTPITGVDNHKKSVCFGAALLKHEDEESFTWVFEKFMDCMGGKEPHFIITD